MHFCSYCYHIINLCQPLILITYCFSSGHPCFHRIEGPVGCLPLLSWMWSPRSESTGTNTALLAFGRGSTLNVLRVTTILGPTYSTTLSTGLDSGRLGSTGSEEQKSLSGILHFHTLYSFELGYELISINVSGLLPSV